ncbi:MAG: hypothetical protein K2M76_02570, partial [Muribaculaceae bacterium]|nr:hypothetical protein [Muribaculaceae bacterium]
NYEGVVSLSADFESVAFADDGSGAAPDSVVLPMVYNSPMIRIADNDLAMAICQLQGVSNAANFDSGYVPVYMRVRAYIDDMKDRSMVMSNTVSMDVKSYFVTPALDGPDNMYVTGDADGWKFRFKLVPDSKFQNYTGFAALKGGFKFSDSPGWSGTSWGAGAAKGSLVVGASNIAVDRDGLYWVSFNYSNATYKLTYIESVAVVGDFNDGKEDAGMEMVPEGTGADADYSQWQSTGVSGSYKFVMNHSWDINLGGSMDNLILSGGNLAGQGENKEITLELGDGSYTCTYADVR